MRLDIDPTWRAWLVDDELYASCDEGWRGILGDLLREFHGALRRAPEARVTVLQAKEKTPGSASTGGERTSPRRSTRGSWESSGAFKSSLIGPARPRAPRRAAQAGLLEFHPVRGASGRRAGALRLPAARPGRRTAVGAAEQLDLAPQRVPGRRFAARLGVDPMIGALTRLARDNASTLSPDPLYALVHHSHPSACAICERWRPRPPRRHLKAARRRDRTCPDIVTEPCVGLIGMHL